MNLDAIRAFADRDWTALEQSKRAHWAREFREHGASAALEACWSLWQHVREVQPGWPDEAQRADDLVHHEELSRKLRAVARVHAAR